MAKADYKVNESITVIVRMKAGATSVNMDVYDELDALDAIQSGAMTQIGTSKIWKKTFTPDTEGDWHIKVFDDLGGETIKHYSVGQFNINAIGADVATLDAKVDAIDGKLTNIENPPMIG
jgi:hypothetical protein